MHLIVRHCEEQCDEAISHFHGEIAAFPSVTRNDNVTILYAFVLVCILSFVIPAKAGIQDLSEKPHPALALPHS
jgi:hypothetical protein